MNAANVAVPTSMTAAVRMPAMITGAASGSRTSRRIWPAVMPSARAAERAAALSVVVRMADGAGAGDSRGIRVAHTGERVADDRIERVQDECDERRPHTDAAHRNQESQQRDAWPRRKE